MKYATMEGSIPLWIYLLVRFLELHVLSIYSWFLITYILNAYIMSCRNSIQADTIYSSANAKDSIKSEE